VKQTIDIARRNIEDKRLHFRAQCHELYLPKFDLLCLELDRLGLVYFRPYSVRRSPQVQAVLYAKGRTEPGKVVTNAPPGKSPHNYGCASDWADFSPGYVGRDSWNKADWGLYAKAVELCGLDWGGNFHSIGDVDHNELKISVSWAVIGAVFNRSPEEAESMIHSKLII
jgi:D-alanyl-D-alanine carboxypeptidase-like protein